MTDFYNKVYRIARQIPKGHVATYGQIAALLSTPRAARMVGTALRSLPDDSDVPWHRVISGKGIITIENMEHPTEEQANLLMAEGVIVTKVDGEYTINLKEYLWSPESLEALSDKR